MLEAVRQVGTIGPRQICGIRPVRASCLPMNAYSHQSFYALQDKAADRRHSTFLTASFRAARSGVGKPGHLVLEWGGLGGGSQREQRLNHRSGGGRKMRFTAKHGPQSLTEVNSCLDSGDTAAQCCLRGVWIAVGKGPRAWKFQSFMLFARPFPVKKQAEGACWAGCEVCGASAWKTRARGRNGAQSQIAPTFHRASDSRLKSRIVMPSTVISPHSA